jgi:hypothetical protein
MDPDDIDDDEDALPEGEFADLEDDEFGGVTDTDDGGAMVTMEDSVRPSEGEFYDNLAEDMSDTELGTIATRFLDLIVKDKDARKRACGAPASATTHPAVLRSTARPRSCIRC